ncbi:BESS motif domain-containing protein [Phthorimaea operculella]|nr:BESS motif domain-containing protein [Phthorimaea operculella]
MQFEYDPELLIEEIKKRPGIWDYSDVNYRTMAARVDLWNEVVETLLQPDVKVTKTEMRELVIQLQKKWKGVKDAFVKYIQNPNRSKRPYLYSKQLHIVIKDEQSSEEDATYVDVEPFMSDTEKSATKPKPVEDFAFASVSNIESAVEDCDKMFLLSLLPHLKSIPEENRLNAKMELLQVLRNANHHYSITGRSMVD